MPSTLEIILYILIGAGALIYITHSIYRTFKPKQKKAEEEEILEEAKEDKKEVE